MRCNKEVERQPAKPLSLPVVAYILSTTKLEIRAK
jgi:hypothetical protein